MGCEEELLGDEGVMNVLEVVVLTDTYSERRGSGRHSRSSSNIGRSHQLRLPPRRAEREGKNGVSEEGCPNVGRKNRLDGSCGDYKGLGHRGLVVSKELDDVERDKAAWETTGIGTGWHFSSCMGWGTEPGRRHLAKGTDFSFFADLIIMSGRKCFWL